MKPLFRAVMSTLCLALPLMVLAAAQPPAAAPEPAATAAPAVPASTATTAPAASAAPTATAPAPAATPTGTAATGAAAQRYPLWNGTETVAEYAKRAGIKESQLAVEVAPSIAMKMVLIPSATYMAGDPRQDWRYGGNTDPAHQVTITRPFYMGIYHVTQAQWKAVCGTMLVQQRDKGDPSWPLVGEGADYPMYYVSWDEADGFAKRVSQFAGMTVRLPTEAEWELACRSGTATPFFFGEKEAGLADYAWFRDNSDGKVQPVGKKKPNPWGLYDISGSVLQWCSDWYAGWDKDAYLPPADGRGARGDASARGRVGTPLTDPEGPESGMFRSLRGGSWETEAHFCCSFARSRRAPTTRTSYIGFRVIMELAKP